MFLGMLTFVSTALLRVALALAERVLPLLFRLSPPPQAAPSAATESRQIRANVRRIIPPPLFKSATSGGLAVNLFAAVPLPLVLEILGVLVRAPRDAHQDAAFLESLLVVLDAL